MGPPPHGTTASDRDQITISMVIRRSSDGEPVFRSSQASVRVVPATRAHGSRHAMYLSPSLTPRNPPHDPSVRLYAYERTSGRVLNWTDFSLDVREI